MKSPRQALVFVAAFLLLPHLAAAQQKLKKTETRYYIIHSDLDDDAIREARLRIELMAEEYYQRTKSFSGRISKRLPFYLFRKQEDYLAAGGTPGTGGVFTGDRLMAIAGEKTGKRTWHIVQHEGFHQFVAEVIRGKIPIWVNEGLAEYFGEGIFTGDGFITGVVPQDRLERVRKLIRDDRAKSVRMMMKTQHSDWNLELTGENYDQAWSMVHFLAHAENGKYQKPFTAFMKAVSNGTEHQTAWEASFGRGTAAFEDAWKRYWLEMPDNPSADKYAEATTAILTSFLGRAISQKQKFADAEAFLKAARAGELKAHREDWLPPSLLERALNTAEKVGEFSLELEGKLPRLVCVTAGGTRIVGQFRLKGARIGDVNVKLAR